MILTKALQNPWFKRTVIAACLLPLTWIAWRWYNHRLGINSIEKVAKFTGDWTIQFLLASLAITPLRRIRALSFLAPYRKVFGLYAFFYGCLHALHYYARDVQWNLDIIKEDLTIRRFFIAGAIALLAMLPLALTSTDSAIRRLGGQRWRKLHRLAYVAGIAGAVHYLWQGKIATTWPLVYAAILFVLLAARVPQWLKR